MPIITLELVEDSQPNAQAALPDGDLQALTDELDKIFNSNPGGTWVRLHYLPRANVHVIYAPPGAGRVAFGGKLVGTP